MRIFRLSLRWRSDCQESLEPFWKVDDVMDNRSFGEALTQRVYILCMLLNHTLAEGFLLDVLGWEGFGLLFDLLLEAFDFDFTAAGQRYFSRVV